MTIEITKKINFNGNSIFAIFENVNNCEDCIAI